MASSSSHNNSSSSALIQQLDPKSRDLTAKIVAHLKSQGNFDELRRDCLEELDKMEAFRQLNQRVESYVATFLSKQEWSESLSKNQIRDNLRKHVCASDALKSGAQRLVSQVLEKKSKTFQTRLEGVVQNYIYMEKERERQPRYHSRFESDRGFKSSENKCESEKSSSGKRSTISDINDIISQIPGHEQSATSKSEGSSISKIDSRDSPHQTTSGYHKTDSSLTKQQVSGIHSKGEHGKFERRGDSSSLVDSLKTTPPSKTNLGAKKVNPSKRVVPKSSASQNTGTSSDKNVDSNTNQRTKNPYNKPSYSPKVESPRDRSDPITDVDRPHKKTETVVATLKSDIHRKSPLSHASKSSYDTVEKSKHSEIGSGLQLRQKVEDKHVDTTKPIHETIKIVDTETKVDEKASFETQTKREAQERKTKDSTSFEKSEESKVIKTDSKDEIFSGDDHEEITTEESVQQNSESDEGSDVSDVSSVHTSDLSSFDGEVSSDSKGSDEEDPGKVHSKKESIGGTFNLEKRSKRKSKRSSGKDTDESIEKGRRNPDTHKTSKSSRMRNQGKSSSAEASDITTKRKRGRPRKELSTSSDTQNEHGDLKQPRSRIQLANNESSDSMPARHRSKRPIKKRRCYSPSSDSTREVCLPSKRSRVSSKD